VTIRQNIAEIIVLAEGLRSGRGWPKEDWLAKLQRIKELVDACEEEIRE